MIGIEHVPVHILLEAADTVVTIVAHRSAPSKTVHVKIALERELIYYSLVAYYNAIYNIYNNKIKNAAVK